MTIGEKYGPAMEITDPEEAKVYFEKLVHIGIDAGMSRKKAEDIELFNLGYYAGYYGLEIMKRVERLFNAPHPFIGKVGD